MLSPANIVGNADSAGVTSTFLGDYACTTSDPNCLQLWNITVPIDQSSCSYTYLVYDYLSLGCTQGSGCPLAGNSELLFAHTFSSPAVCPITLTSQEVTNFDSSLSLQAFSDSLFSSSYNSYTAGDSAFWSIVVTSSPITLVFHPN
jgi:hypothetical protein